MLNKSELASLLELFDDSNIPEPTLDFHVEKISGSQRDKLILEIIKRTYHADLKPSGEHRIPDWEAGWSENLAKYESGGQLSQLVPGYFSSNTVIRLAGDLYKASTSLVEPELLGTLIYDLLKKFCASATHIYEFGCGSGNNIQTVRRALPNAQIVGLDWAIASQKIISAVAERGDINNLTGHNFNFFKPDYSFELSSSGAVFTCAALEQVGTNWYPFVDYLLAAKPGIVVNIEPISELLDGDTLLDALSIEYARRRNHLNGYFEGLVELERSGKIKILFKKRSTLGSIFLNGYSVVVWEVCSK